MFPAIHGARNGSPFECNACRDPLSPAPTTEEIRRGFHCGWMDTSEWTHPLQLPDYIGPIPYAAREPGETPEAHEERLRATVCPGRIVQLPQILQASRACQAWRTGQLELAFEPTAALIEAVMELDVAAKAQDAHELEQDRPQVPTQVTNV